MARVVKIEEESVRGKVSESAGKTFYSTIPSPKWPICPQLYARNSFFLTLLEVSDLHAWLKCRRNQSWGSV